MQLRNNFVHFKKRARFTFVCFQHRKKNSMNFIFAAIIRRNDVS